MAGAVDSIMSGRIAAPVDPVAPIMAVGDVSSAPQVADAVTVDTLAPIPSTIVSLGNTPNPTLFGVNAAVGVAAYAAVQNTNPVAAAVGSAVAKTQTSNSTVSSLTEEIVEHVLNNSSNEDE